MKKNLFKPLTVFILSIFLLMAMYIVFKYQYHQYQVKTLTQYATSQYTQYKNNMRPGMHINYSLIPESDIEIVTDEHNSLMISLFQTIVIYLPAAFLILFISFITAVGSAYNPYSPFAKLSRLPVQIIDSIPLIFWVIMALILIFRIFSHPYWGETFLKYLYYPALSFSYGMALIVIFFQQNKRTIEEIRSQNILYGEMVTGISNLRIIARMFWYHFAKTIIIRQFTYAVLYLLLFDYCLMFTFEDYRQVDCGFTPLTVKAGLYLLRFNNAELLGKEVLMHMYEHLHWAAFYLVLTMALGCFFILFMIFDRKEIIND